MAITNNQDLVNTYDGNFQVESTRILPDIAPHDDEHAAQCVAIETLRSLMALGITPQQYNEMVEADWQAVIADSKSRAALNINAPVAHLTDSDIQGAANIGGNYFEHGYLVVMAGINSLDKIRFTRIGGL